ncbi:MAG: iron complex outermembrane receptor protein, partial [Paraglaciecola psychrophila]
MKRLPFTKTSLSTALGLSALAAVSSTALQAQDRVIEEVVVVAEKRSENLQDLSQAVTSIGESELEVKNISSFVDLSAIAPGVTVAKNEGYKTVISIRGVGNEANQNAIANPSVSFHMDGIYIASPFALQTDFIDVERIEVLRGPQGTLFGQNSTAGAINVISKRPNSEELEGKADLTVGDYNLTKLRGSINIPISDSIATRTSFSSSERDGFTKNIHNGQELDDVSSISFRSDWSFDVSDTTNFRVFAQYFDADSNGAAIKGIDDRTRDDRKLSQDTKAQYELESKIVGAIAEFDLDFASIKTLASWQEDDILVVRDNDRHNFGDTLPNGSPYIRSEFNPETSVVETKTFEVNIISNEPLMGSLDWIVGAFYLETDIENSIREFLD